DWLAHLRRAYAPAAARSLLRAWSHEDFYVPLETEIELMRDSRFRVEVLWRRGAFAVLRAARGTSARRPRLVRLEQAAQLALGGVVGSGAGGGGRLDSEVLFRVAGRHLEHDRLPTHTLGLRHDPEAATVQIKLLGHRSRVNPLTELFETLRLCAVVEHSRSDKNARV